jgi:hypothetical protein
VIDLPMFLCNHSRTPFLPFFVWQKELQDLKEMLKEEKASEDQQYLRRAIDKLRRGENRKRLAIVPVVGVRPHLKQRENNIMPS